MASSKARTERPLPGPDELVRESAGSYRSGDGRFEVQKSDQGWYVIDSQQSDELGQQLIHGPLPTLDAVRAALAGLRELKPMPRICPRRRPAATPPAPPPPPSWIDQLPSAEARKVRELISALQRERVDDAEALVRRQRSKGEPLIASRLLEQRLEALLAGDDDAQREMIGRVVELLSDGAPDGPLPGWALVEVAADSQPPLDRIKPRVRPAKRKV